MPLSTIERIRGLIGDMSKAAVSEEVAKGDAATTIFQLDMFPVRTGSVSIFVSGSIKTSATILYPLGTFDLTGSAPASGDQIIASYQYNALSDDEIQSIIDSVSGVIGDRIMLAASIACASIAGNYSRFFMYTQGEKTVNKDKLADKLMALSERYQEIYEFSVNSIGTNLTIASFDDSGTAFEGYDTGVAGQYETGTF